MKKATKYGMIIGLPAITILLMYFLTPIKAWKKYQQDHPALFETKDEPTPTYWDFCQSYWKTFVKYSEGKEGDITYTGGQLPDIDIVAPKLS